MNRKFYAIGALSFMAFATAGLTACDPEPEPVIVVPDETPPTDEVTDECPRADGQPCK